MVRQVPDHSTKETIKQFQSIFAELGIPRNIHCDRGANYTSIEFQRFLEWLSVSISYSSSEHHSSNYAERSVQVVKGFMKKSEEWPICLLEYLMTPIRHQGIDKSPIKLMQTRTIRGLLPVRQGETNQDDYERYQARRSEQGKYQKGVPLPVLPEGSNVLFHSERDKAWIPGIIVQRLHDRSYVIISQKGRKVIRNRIDLKPYHKDVQINFQSSPQSTYQRPTPSITSTKTSSSYPQQTDITKHKSVQPDHHHTSPQKHPGSSRPINSKSNKTPPLPSQSCHSPLDSPTNSPSQIPPPPDSLNKSTVGSATRPDLKPSGRIIPQRQETQCKSIAKPARHGETLPQRTKSGRAVRRPARFQD